MQKPRFDELTDERIRQIEATWKSDIESKIDMLVAAEKERAEKYDAFIDVLMKREMRRERLWDAIIDKGLTMMIVAGVVALFSLAWNGAMGELVSRMAGKK
jgi:hypothetical protein